MLLPPAAWRAWLLVSLLAGCAGPPAVDVPAGSRVVVRWNAGRQRVELALANESYPELAAVYSQRRRDASLKLAPDRLIGELLYSLEQAALDAYAIEGGPESLPAGTGWLLVEQDGRRRLFAEPLPGDPVEKRTAWSHVKLLMDHYYQHVGALQFVENPEGGAFFRETP